MRAHAKIYAQSLLALTIKSKGKVCFRLISAGIERRGVDAGPSQATSPDVVDAQLTKVSWIKCLTQGHRRTNHSGSNSILGYYAMYM